MQTYDLKGQRIYKSCIEKHNRILMNMIIHHVGKKNENKIRGRLRDEK